ncbi:hypothetical protein [Nocardia sp. NPDC058633]|uniref:hypothetical protein n=1 Tax=Nocardia sp. NPDC058633 TaxID=3346568 RepID=UPI003653F738
MAYLAVDRARAPYPGRIGETGAERAAFAAPAPECNRRQFDAVPVPDPSTVRRGRGESAGGALPRVGA